MPFEYGLSPCSARVAQRTEAQDPVGILKFKSWGGVCGSRFWMCRCGLLGESVSPEQLLVFPALAQTWPISERCLPKPSTSPSSPAPGSAPRVASPPSEGPEASGGSGKHR